jgi:hypothetical protein
MVRSSRIRFVLFSFFFILFIIMFERLTHHKQNGRRPGLVSACHFLMYLRGFQQRFVDTGMFTPFCVCDTCHFFIIIYLTKIHPTVQLNAYIVCTCGDPVASDPAAHARVPRTCSFKSKPRRAMIFFVAKDPVSACRASIGRPSTSQRALPGCLDADPR